MSRSERIAQGVWVESHPHKKHGTLYRVRVRHPRYRDGRNSYPYKNPDRGLARLWAAEIAGKLTAGAEERTVGDVLREFERVYLPTVKVRTQETWSADIRNHLIRFFGSTPVLLLELTAAFKFGEEMHLGRYGPDQMEGRQYAGWTIRCARWPRAGTRRRTSTRI